MKIRDRYSGSVAILSMLVLGGCFGDNFFGEEGQIEFSSDLDFVMVEGSPVFTWSPAMPVATGTRWVVRALDYDGSFDSWLVSDSLDVWATLEAGNALEENYRDVGEIGLRALQAGVQSISWEGQAYDRFTVTVRDIDSWGVEDPVLLTLDNRMGSLFTQQELIIGELPEVPGEIVRILEDSAMAFYVFPYDSDGERLAWNLGIVDLETHKNDGEWVSLEDDLLRVSVGDEGEGRHLLLSDDDGRKTDIEFLPVSVDEAASIELLVANEDASENQGNLAAMAVVRDEEGNRLWQVPVEWVLPSELAINEFIAQLAEMSPDFTREDVVGLDWTGETGEQVAIQLGACVAIPTMEPSHDLLAQAQDGREAGRICTQVSFDWLFPEQEDNPEPPRADEESESNGLLGCSTSGRVNGLGLTALALLALVARRPRS